MAFIKNSTCKSEIATASETEKLEGLLNCEQCGYTELVQEDFDNKVCPNCQAELSLVSTHSDTMVVETSSEASDTLAEADEDHTETK